MYRKKIEIAPYLNPGTWRPILSNKFSQLTCNSDSHSNDDDSKDDNSHCDADYIIFPAVSFVAVQEHHRGGTRAKCACVSCALRHIIYWIVEVSVVLK